VIPARAIARTAPTGRSIAIVAVAGAWLGLALLTAPPAITLARFTNGATSSGTFASDTLAPPTGLAATGGSSVTLTWTPTVDGYATGYTVLRGAASGGPYSPIGSVTPRTAATTSDGPAAGTWYYVLRSAYQSWSSADSNQASAVIAGATTTTIKSCTATAAETTDAGDNNGYESNPSRACTDDGSAALDDNSGSGGTASCGTGAAPATTKDQHRFWGYAFGLPGSVSSIAGITVRADLALNNNGGTTNLCTQLSWDGGTTWTTIKSLAASGTGQSAYTFGSTSDAWGRTWAIGDFATTNFRVRVIDASTMSNKGFELDYVGVQVTYTP
jgi:hypothetical protein